MIERSVAQALLDRVARHGRRLNATAVRRVVVRVGALSGVDPELLARAFTALSERTVCHGAELVVNRSDARWECPRCGTAIPRDDALRCSCGEPARLVQGDELELERIDVASTPRD